METSELGLEKRTNMAACATTYFETGRGWGARIAERNTELMAQQAQRRRRVRTPEFFFAKHFDNSRLVKAVRSGARPRDARLFGRRRRALLAHHGLRPAALLRHREQLPRGERKADARQLREENRQLRLSEAELTQPGRIDQMARQLASPSRSPARWSTPTRRPASGAPTLAQIAPAAPAAQ